MYKHLHYAYPSSSHATKLGHGRTGCWYVFTTEKALGGLSDAKASHVAFADKSKALDYFESIELPVGRYSFTRQGGNVPAMHTA